MPENMTAEEQALVGHLPPVIRAKKIYPDGLNPDPSSSGYVNFVPATGPDTCPIMLVGEAPGAEEDRLKKTFIGPAGQLLNTLLAEAGLSRDNIFVTNVYRFRPPGNRTPTDDEIEAHVPFLVAEISRVKPKVIVLLGGTAYKAFIGGNLGITKARGVQHWCEEFDCTVIPTYHPSYLLHSPGDTRIREQLVSDLLLARECSGANDPAPKPVRVDNGAKYPTDYKLVKTVEEFKELMVEVNKAETVEFDLETTGLDVDKHRIMCVALSYKEFSGRVVPVYVNGKDWWGGQQAWVWGELKKFFESQVPKCAHLGSFDIPFLRAAGIMVENYSYDTLLMHYLLDENARSHGLKELALEYTDLGEYDSALELCKTELVEKKKARIKELTKKAKTGLEEAERHELAGLKAMKPSEIDFALIPFDVLWPYACGDVDATGRLRRKFFAMIEEQGIMPAFRRIIMPAQVTICDMEWNGIKIDLKKLRAIRAEYEAIAADITKQLQAHPVTDEAKRVLEKDEINYGSPVQLRAILFDILKLKPVKETKTGNASTDESTLKELAKVHEIPKLITQLRSYEHLVSAYGEGFESAIRKDGRIHSKFLLHGTEIGRLSSRGPNLQNIPRAEVDMQSGQATIASRAREPFVAEEGSWLVEADYSQIQYRIWANYAQDPRMLDDILNKRDVHKINASVIFSVPVEKVTKEQRQAAKAFTYATIMLATAWKISKHFTEDVGMPTTEEQAQRYINEFFARYPMAKRYEKGMIKMAREKGYVTSLFGTRRRLPEILSPEKKFRGHAERNAVNTPIQQLEAHISLIAMNRIRRSFKEECLDSRLVLQVHDSITSEARDENLNKTIQIMHREMTREIPGVTVPIDIEIKVGRSLGSQKKLSEEELAKILGGN